MKRFTLAAAVLLWGFAASAQAQFANYVVSGHNGQFTQRALTNGPLTPLVNDQFYGHVVNIWLTDSTGKGSYHTFDWTGTPSDFVVMPWGPPNTTTNTQQFMYFRKIGSSWYASPITTLPWVTATFL